MPVRITTLPGTLQWRAALQQRLAQRLNQPWLIKPDNLCPKCQEPLYCVNNVPYDTWLIHRCPLCGYDLHLPVRDKKKKKKTL